MSLFFPIREVSTSCRSLLERIITPHKLDSKHDLELDFTKLYVGGCSWQSWWEGGGVVDPELRICEAVPSREYRLWKAAKSNERFFCPFLPSSLQWVGCWGQLASESAPLRKLPASAGPTLTMRKGVWSQCGTQCWVCQPTMRCYVWGRWAGQPHWGLPAWKESRVKTAGKWQQHVISCQMFVREDWGLWYYLADGVFKPGGRQRADPLQFWLLPDANAEQEQ